MTEEKTHWTQAELIAEAARRFGENRREWRFECPQCGDVATAQDFLDAGEPADSLPIGVVCIGRVTGALTKQAATNTRGCDWAAFGLFRGPWFVKMPDGREVPSFPLAKAAS